MKEVWFFWVAEYEDARPVGPFATKELAEKAFAVYDSGIGGSFNKPSYKVVPWKIMGAEATDELIANFIEQYGED